ncbi:methyltransferase [Shewanella sp. 10N.7]|uniref:tRNA1(Val) (adenine(37)-N6)-methyltransferase n=1 Tax=Shewanella sp. 10N.7 TaxID=2885093 RepID=UPI001E45813E|nr:methyltransferase [Shewanella sp. 10N.7]MCC4831711.1 methyltransferase [Shewanella sp. 10N.7]
MPFTFKQFHIDDSHCGMPVSTDGVILGAWAKLSTDNTKGPYRVLDVGAGSGLLSLMLAQRLRNPSAEIIAVELDEGAAQDCQSNFNQSPWASQLTVQHTSIQRYRQELLKANLPLFETIICNPPYFENGPQSDAKQRATARHTDTLNFETLLTQVQLLLAEHGTASFIIPVQSETGFLAALACSQLEISDKTHISTVETKAPSRLLLAIKHQACLIESTDSSETKEQSQDQSQPQSQPRAQPQSRHQAQTRARPQYEPITSNLVIADGKGQYTQAMIQLCRDFYLKL